MKRNLIFVLLLVAALVLSVSAAASDCREETRVGNLYLADDGGISPSKLPRHEAVPITAWIDAEIGTLDGTHPPALETVEFEVDKTIRLDAVGLPVCRIGQLKARNTGDARRACGEAIVGGGEAEVEVAFPDQTPFSATGPLVLFNGGVKGGTTRLFVHAYVNVPAPTAIVTEAKVKRIRHGRYGMRIEARIPKIAGGSGSATRFEMKIGRRFASGGRQKSLLSASCPTGAWMTAGRVRFDDGTRLGLTHTFSCTPAG